MFQNQPTLAVNRPFFCRIEGLRGLGAMAVAGYHLTGSTIHSVELLPASGWPHASEYQNVIGQLGRLALSGHAFLMAFFVISGFVLRLSLGHGPQNLRDSATKFIVARLFRFYPIVFVAVMVSALMMRGSPSHGTITLKQFIANLLLIDVSMNKHLWALQVELLMMPVIFGLYLVECRSGPRLLFAIAIVSSGLSFAPRWAGWPPLSHNLFAFVFGMLVPTVGRDFVARLNRRVAAAVLTACLAVMISTGATLGTYSRFAGFFEGYAAFVAVSTVAYRPELQMLRPLDTAWLRRVGTAAGSYYVLHMATAPLAIQIAIWAIPAHVCVQFPGLVSVGVICIWLIGIAPLMVLVSKAIEEPGIVYGRNVIRRLLAHPRPAFGSSHRPVDATIRRAA